MPKHTPKPGHLTDEADLFRSAIEDVTPLRSPARVTLERPRPDPLPLQRWRVEPAALRASLGDCTGDSDLESGEELPIVPEVFAEQYRQMMKEHIDALTTKCSDVRIDYMQLTTSRPLDEALFTYLGNRERLMRIR